ncbi:MAG: TonB-dependent receptor [Candidatus Acidiferrum sp.]
MRSDSACPHDFRARFSRLALLSLSAILLLATPHLAAGQATTRGTIAGTVTDQSGGSVAGADVTATEVSTGTVYKVKTGSAGNYRFSDLLVGTYSVRVDAKGFKEALSTNLIVQLDTTTTLDVTLQRGSVSDVVTVNIETTNLETQSSDVGTVITTQQVLDLPLALGGVGATRSAEGFVFLVPGTTGPGTNNGAGGVFESKISGGQDFGTEVLLDGASMERSENGSSFDEAGPSVEAIGQFKVVTSTPSADFGRSTGGWETFLTKAGTNQYHGDVYEIMQNADLNANNFFNNARGVGRPPDTKNDYGLTFGGPIWVPKVYNGHDKTFGFFSWEQYKQNQGATVLSTVPTVAERSGDFSAVLGPGITQPGPGGVGTVPVINPCTGQQILTNQIFDPSSTTTVGGVPCRDPFPSNMIPTGDISQIAKNVLALIPMPQNSNTFDNLDFSSTGTITDTLMTVRIDHNFSWKDKVFFTYNSRDNAHMPLDVQYTGPAYPGGQFQNFFTHYIRAGWDHAFTPTLLNQFAVGYNRTNSLNVGSSVFLGTEWDQKLGITGLPTNNVFPAFTFGNGIDNAGYNINGDTIDNGYPINNTLSWVHGKHTLRFGTNLNLQVFDPTTQQNESGSFGFGNGQTAAYLNSPGTGFGLASFELGLVQTANATAYASQPKFIQKYYALFVQDDWKLTPTLTLNLGLRWDVDTPRYEAHGDYTDFSTTAIDPTTGLPGALVFAGVGTGRNGNVQEQWANTWYKDFGPRVGFAWAPDFLHQKTVLRGGYSIYYGPIVYADFGAGGLLDGFASSPSFTSPDGFSPAFNIASGFPAYTAPPNLNPGQLGFLASPFYLDHSNGRPAMVQNWSLEVQHKLPWDLLLDVAYVGTTAAHLRSQFDDFNILNPKYFALGNLLNQPISSPAAIAAGINSPYPAFPSTAVVGQALLPFPKYGVVNGDCCLENEGQSSYNGLQTSLSHRFTNGLTLLASYTFSKTLTDAADSLLPDFSNFAGGVGPQEPLNHKDDKSISTQDIPNTFVLSYLYQLPVGPGKKFVNKGGVVGRVVGGWEIGAVQRYQSGEPLSFGCATGVPGYSGCIRYSLVPGQPLTSASVRNGTFNPISSELAAPCQKNGNGTFSDGPAYTDANGIYHPSSASLYFNCAAFVDPNIVALNAPLGTVPYAFGDLPRVIGNVRSQNFFNEDFSLNKRTKITEKTDILLRADFLNATNRHVLALPGTSGPNDTSGAFGSISSTAYPSAFGNQNSFGRIIQLSLKVEF